MGGKSNDFIPVVGAKNCLGETSRKRTKNQWGKNIITHDYNPVDGEWS
jgi:hypothetical protein